MTFAMSTTKFPELAGATVVTKHIMGKVDGADLTTAYVGWKRILLRKLANGKEVADETKGAICVSNCMVNLEKMANDFALAYYAQQWYMKMQKDPEHINVAKKYGMLSEDGKSVAPFYAVEAGTAKCPNKKQFMDNCFARAFTESGELKSEYRCKDQYREGNDKIPSTFPFKTLAIKEGVEMPVGPYATEWTWRATGTPKQQFKISATSL